MKELEDIRVRNGKNMSDAFAFDKLRDHCLLFHPTLLQYPTAFFLVIHPCPVLSWPSDQPLLASPPDVIFVRSTMLPTGKAHVDDLRRLFSKLEPHVFCDATIHVNLVGPHAVEFLISHHTQIPEIDFFFKKAISGCTGSQLTPMLRPTIINGNANLVTDLIDAGADVNNKNSNGLSMIGLAICAGRLDVLKILIASGCEIDLTADGVLHKASATNIVDLMEVLCAAFEDIDVNLVDSEGRTPIHIGAIKRFVEVIRFSVQLGGKADVLDCNGWSPLHYAAVEGHLEAVECLLEGLIAASVVERFEMEVVRKKEKGPQHLRAKFSSWD